MAEFLSLNHRKLAAVLILSALMLSAVAIRTAQNARADSWSDDFTSSYLDSRWVQGDIGDIMPDGESHAWAKSFDPPPEYPVAEEDLPLWYGPSIRAEVSLAGDFNIAGKFNCVADVGEGFNVGKLEIQMLDSSGVIVHAFGWADTSNDTNMVYLYARGQGGSVIYSSGEAYSFSIFIGKGMSLSRSADKVSFQIEGSEVFSAEASAKAVKYIQIQFLRQKAGDIELMCTPSTMLLDSITVQTTAAAVPDAPGNLACTGGNGYASLSWQTPTDTGGIPINNYKVYRGTVSGSLVFLTSVGTALAYNDTGLVNGITYYYAVSAENEAGEGALSAESGFQPLTLPGMPTGLQAVAATDRVNLSWEPPISDGGSAVTGYNVYKGSEVGTLAFLTSVGLAQIFSDVNVTGHVSYYYAVSAVSAVGEGPLSAHVEAVPGKPVTPPSEPRELLAQVSDSATTLSWSPPLSSGNAAVTNYTVYRGFNENTLVLHEVLGNVLAYTDINLLNGQAYYYSVSASNSAGESNQSEIIGVTPIAPTLPSTPYEVILVPDYDYVAIQWSSPLDDGNSPITGYKIYSGTAQDNLTVAATLGNVFSYVDTGLMSDTEYYYQLAAVNAVGEGAPTEIINATTLHYPDNPDLPGTNGTEDSSGGWSMTSSFVTVGVLAVSLAVAFLYLRKSGGAMPKSGEHPDKTVDDEPDGNGSHKE